MSGLIAQTDQFGQSPKSPLQRLVFKRENRPIPEERFPQNR
jgi:hypothetical protein